MLDDDISDVESMDLRRDKVEAEEDLKLLANEIRQIITSLKPLLHFSLQRTPVDLTEASLAWSRHLAETIKKDCTQKPGRALLAQKHWAYRLLLNLKITLSALQELEGNPIRCQAALKQLAQYQKMFRQTRRPAVFILSFFIFFACPILGGAIGTTTGAAIEDGLINHTITSWHSPIAIVKDLSDHKLGAILGLITGFMLGLLAGIILASQYHLRFVYPDSSSEKLAYDFIERARAYIAQFTPNTTIKSGIIYIDALSSSSTPCDSDNGSDSDETVHGSTPVFPSTTLRNTIQAQDESSEEKPNIFFPELT